MRELGRSREGQRRRRTSTRAESGWSPARRRQSSAASQRSVRRPPPPLPSSPRACAGSRRPPTVRTTPTRQSLAQARSSRAPKRRQLVDTGPTRRRSAHPGVRMRGPSDRGLLVEDSGCEPVGREPGRAARAEDPMVGERQAPASCSPRASDLAGGRQAAVMVQRATASGHGQRASGRLDGPKEGRWAAHERRTQPTGRSTQAVAGEEWTRAPSALGAGARPAPDAGPSSIPMPTCPSRHRQVPAEPARHLPAASSTALGRGASAPGCWRRRLTAAAQGQRTRAGLPGALGRTPGQQPVRTPGLGEARGRRTERRAERRPRRRSGRPGRAALGPRGRKGRAPAPVRARCTMPEAQSRLGKRRRRRVSQSFTRGRRITRGRRGAPLYEDVTSSSRSSSE